MSHSLPFTRRGLLLAPLVVPPVYAVLFEISAPGRNPVLSVLVLSAIGCAIGYAGTLLLLAPVLFALSRVFRVGPVTCTGTGAVLGGIAYLPELYSSWCASGVDSGPPSTTFRQYAADHVLGPELAAFVVAGAATALACWTISHARPRPVRRAPGPA